MVIDINLLEEQPKPNRMPMVIVTGGLLVLCICLVFFLVQSKALLTEQKGYLSTIQELETKQATVSQSLNNEEQMQRQELLQATKKTKQAIFPTVSLLERMIALLPETGYFESYEFRANNGLEVEVRFETLQQTAAYTDTLLEEDYVEDVEIGNIVTEPVSEDLNQFEYRPRYIVSYTVDINRQAFREEVGASET